MRAAIVLVLAAIAIPLAFFSPLWGLVSYCILSYMRPHDMAYGIGHIAFGFYVTIALFAGLFFRMRFALFKWSPVSLSMLALWAWVGVTTYTAISRDLALEGFGHISKIFVICLITTALCTDKKKLRLVLYAIAGGIAFHGVKMGFYGLVHGGVQIREPIGGMMSGNNENAIALGVALPFCIYFALDETRPMLRLSWWIAAFGTALAVIWSYSRGGFLGMLASLCVIVWRTKYRKVAIFVVVPVILLLFFSIAPGAYVDRVASIGDAGQTDLSAIRRLQAWDIASTITRENPIFGIGPRNFPDFFRRFPHPYDLPRMEIHNTYLEFSSSSGVPGLLLYGLLIVNAFVACGRVARDAARRADTRLGWFIGTARAIQASMTAFLVSSTFGSLMHFDLMYHLCALAACVPVAYRRQLRELLEQDRAAPREDLAEAPYAAVGVALEQPAPAPCETAAAVDHDDDLVRAAFEHRLRVRHGDEAPEAARARQRPAVRAPVPTRLPPPTPTPRERPPVEHRPAPARPWFEPDPSGRAAADVVPVVVADAPAPPREAPAVRAAVSRPPVAEPKSRRRRTKSAPARKGRRRRRVTEDHSGDDEATYFSAFDDADDPGPDEDPKDGSATFLGFADDAADDPEHDDGAPTPQLDDRGLSAFDARVLGRPALRERAVDGLPEGDIDDPL